MVGGALDFWSDGCIPVEEVCDWNLDLCLMSNSEKDPSAVK